MVVQNYISINIYLSLEDLYEYIVTACTQLTYIISLAILLASEVAF